MIFRHDKSVRAHRTVMFYGVIAAFILAVLFAQTAQSETAFQAGEANLDRRLVEAFVDGVVQARMKEHHIVGTTISIVHNGEIILSKGYGYENLELKLKVNPSTSLFRVGSIAKVFTFAGALELAHEGRLDLNADVRDYLTSVDLDLSFNEPLTMLHLMGHTPGFEDLTFGLMYRDPSRLTSISDYLNNEQPKQVLPPGEIVAYSNYGAVLAGQMIADITGVPFENYMEQSIFDPLGMANTTFREPWGEHRPLDGMPEHLSENLSVGYAAENGTARVVPKTFLGHLAPGASLSSTADDMARFMLTLLHDGKSKGVTVLSEDTVRRLKTKHVSMLPDMHGFAHGMMTGDIAGYPSVGHTGGTLYFQSSMEFVPDLNFGVFVATNTDSGWALSEDLAKIVVEHFFSAAPKPAQSDRISLSEDALSTFAGTYHGGRRAHTKVDKIITNALITSSLSVSDDGHLVSSGIIGADTWESIAENRFRSLSDGSQIAFTETSDGRKVLVVGRMPVMVFEKAGFLQNAFVLYAVAVLGALLFLGILVRAAKKIFQSGFEREKPLLQAAKLSILSAAGCLLTTLIAVVVGVVPLISGWEALFFNYPPPSFGVAAVLATFGVVLTGVALLLVPFVLISGEWGLSKRAAHSAIVATAVLVSVVYFHFNLIIL